MTAETKTAIDGWIADESMAVHHGAVYDPGNDGLTCVGIDGCVDLSELADLIETAERERCARIAESGSCVFPDRLRAEGFELAKTSIASQIRGEK